jgi:hypothetical protein
MGTAERSEATLTRLGHSESERVSLSVGLSHYMANACGHLLGTLL